MKLDEMLWNCGCTANGRFRDGKVECHGFAWKMWLNNVECVNMTETMMSHANDAPIRTYSIYLDFFFNYKQNSHRKRRAWQTSIDCSTERFFDWSRSKGQRFCGRDDLRSNQTNRLLLVDSVATVISLATDPSPSTTSLSASCRIASDSMFTYTLPMETGTRVGGRIAEITMLCTFYSLVSACRFKYNWVTIQCANSFNCVPAYSTHFIRLTPAQFCAKQKHVKILLKRDDVKSY